MKIGVVRETLAKIPWRGEKELKMTLFLGVNIDQNTLVFLESIVQKASIIQMQMQMRYIATLAIRSSLHLLTGYLF